MPNENLGWLVLFGSVGALGYIGVLITYFHFKHDLFSLGTKSILSGAALVFIYAMYGSIKTDHSAMDIAMNKVPIGEIKRPVSDRRSILPAHLIGYVLISGGFLLLTSALLINAKKP